MQLKLVEIFLFGFGLAISIGPVAIAVMNKCLSKGFKDGALCAVGAGIGDFTFAFIAYNFHKAVTNLLNVNMNIVQLFSSVVLILFGAYLVYSAFLLKTKLTIQNNVNPNINLISIYLLALSSPISIAAFLALFGQVTIQNYSIVNGLFFSSAILVGSLSAQSIIVCSAVLARRLLNFSELDHKYIIIGSNIISGFFIFSFGFYNIIYLNT